MDILTQLLPNDDISQLENEFFDFSERYFSSWDELRERKIIIFGAGLFGQMVADTLRKEKICPYCFIDSNKNTWGTIRKGISIKPVCSLQDHPDAIVILSSAYAREMAEISHQYGVTTILPIDLPATDMPTPPIGYRINDITEKLVMLNELLDKKSQYILQAFLKFQLTLHLKYVHEIYSPHPYFDEDMVDKVDYKIFCDLGASVGDTFKEYLEFSLAGKLGSFSYYAFEPDRESFESLAALAQEYSQLEAIYGAVGSVSGVCQISGAEKMSTAFWSEGLNMRKVPLYALDDYSFSKGIPTVIKADVEGN